MQVPPSSPLVFVISGPSGVGKDAVIKELLRARPNLHFVVHCNIKVSLRPTSYTLYDDDIKIYYYSISQHCEDAGL